MQEIVVLKDSSDGKLLKPQLMLSGIQVRFSCKFCLSFQF
jgi:hypothetical protein